MKGAELRPPAGARMLFRRALAALFCFALWGALVHWLAAILGHDGWSPIGLLILLCFALASPWTVLGAVNAALGFWLLHVRGDALAAVAPFAEAGHSGRPLASRTAVLLTIRNEDAERAFARVEAVKRSVDATGEGAAFDWFVLSDTSDPDIAAREDALFDAWRETEGTRSGRLHYRRRAANRGYKAGNIADFCRRWGDGYEFMIPLDADSLMDGETILSLARIGEADPKIGVIQSLVVGAPSRSAFARMFQFGMRAGMRAYSMGAAWWAGDCGPFWGHNALVRVAPFEQHCRLPKLRGGGHILSHDQIEAALMRRAGYEVRLLPAETGSFEENPPTLPEFMRRELRWCRGNMQYVELLTLPGLLPMSRFHLVWAISMFIGAPAWTAIIALSAVLPHVEDMADFPIDSAGDFYMAFLLLHLSPKLAGYADAALAPGGLRRYGGRLRFCVGASLEICASFVIGAATTLAVAGCLLKLDDRSGREWRGQKRDAHRLSWRGAARELWPQLLFGVPVLMLAAEASPALLLASLPLTIGYVAAIPFAVASASPWLGRAFQTAGLCATPEELDPPALLRDAASDRRAMG
ncbi:glucans biosynthesis glucosyltransferase MdoH [Methylosinus sp. Sm6]|uniref:glucans biosynthesis glucosyltransferase MdoH n=1 Tax=Methylosinus sp. Sm6 TaxID=2866948 RepID=UPI001C9995F9|nr:glucans biosynthesis glucosyltransferase MdoH [Methylosinus sp. Sm6]MBY6242142.1 glucans biosynthesis glucosyltransferase MdoH [Methylosinus sp. Sm6]